jgi:DNA-binding transcriptional ArsR family regulator
MVKRNLVSVKSRSGRVPLWPRPYAPPHLTMRSAQSNARPAAASTIKLGQGDRVVEEAVSYAVGHRIRIEILAILNEGVRTPDELARLTHQPLTRVGHHIKELLEDGSIELAYLKPVRNTVQHYYRAVEVAFHSDDEVTAMPPEARQAIIGVTLQAVMAEALAAFWAGKMVEDPRVWLSWRWFNVDMQGREDIADEQARSWARVQEIEAESAARCVGSGKSTTSIIVTSLGYVRSRTSSSPPVTTPLTGKLTSR